MEHPNGARSWSTAVMRQLLELPRVWRVAFGFCMAGMKAEGDDGVVGPARKRTGIATNSEAVAAALEQLQCDGSHKHVWLNAGRPKGCQVYPVDFCHVLCRAYAHQVILDRAGSGARSIAGIEGVETVDVTEVVAPLVADELAASGRNGGPVLCIEYSYMHESGGGCWAFGPSKVQRPK